ncbi:2-oxoglutarate dehydrogenase complex dihydrolipoyllysine-residue succinyltransferase [Desulforhabdus sp. TSK]|uniref:2-oxoglutarate dehydrogenase complex dihydrolipoyllysine-residue succinyltransferase n=1 Tax=Desulforhabdus sp. TSK TaxID=2925014 RepID=UPI001FC7E6D7|nr:2-oxoglutarate dehydrogenase complex dihydrolipoyllysine-residue succinyltransferase [Desulforhabdus sp. TSK]GKT09561.1 dihydrolipoyllysine-residue succinyltransferase component of 2-oxoglutarate dehydrogenase complex [Desulforhabdus sp. TSK]
MKIDIKVPEVGESVREAVLAEWYARSGDRVRKDQILFLLETDKVTLEISAEADGILEILVPTGETVSIGAVVGTLETTAEGAKTVPGDTGKRETTKEMGEAAPPPPKPERKLEPPAVPHEGKEPPSESKSDHTMPPSVRKLVEEKGIDPSRISGTGPGGRLTRGDVLLYLEESSPASEAAEAPAPLPEQPSAETGKTRPLQPRDAEPGSGLPEESTSRKPMTPIRRRIAERLLEARQNTAMLTTFNEIDMTRVKELRSRFQDDFKARHGISLGIMSFFIKAALAALKEIPEVNAFIEGQDIVYHHYYHVGVAIGGERGLVVPVIRHADRLGFAQLEQAIVDFVKKIQENRLQLSDLEGGTFTISNGGVFGSLLSTPILNTPQSGILGLHKMEDRPVVMDGQIVIRPMMYVAFSYDHRLIDGREAVTFLKRIKEGVEHPERLMLEI